MEGDLIFGVFAYLLVGRLFGYTLYREVFIDFLIKKHIIEYHRPVSEMYNYFDLTKFEKNIRPKWFRNILRIISILIWPVSLCIAIIVITFLFIYGSITSIIKFFTE